MAYMSVVFLGTASGGGPSETRNCSSLVCDMLADYFLWMVDCAEGTARQFALQPPFLNPPLRIQKVTKIFITHMHADHIMGIIPFLRSVLFPPPIVDSTSELPRRTIELYGPAGLRTFVRQNMKMTLSRTADTYIVHELLTQEDPVTPCDDTPLDSPERMDPLFPNVMHYSELPGTDFRANADGFWMGIAGAQGRHHGAEIIVNAGPILHRDPCIGYVFTENSYPSRKLVILGDTYDPSAMVPLCHGTSLLVHEASDSHISPIADSTGKYSKRSPEMVQERALARGHSVPEMAGDFARRIGAKALVLNHIGARFPAPRNPRDFSRINIMQDIEGHANRAWGSGRQCIAAYDYLRIQVPIEHSNVPSSASLHSTANPGHQNYQMEPTESEVDEGRKRRRSEGGVGAERLDAGNFEGTRGRGGTPPRYPRGRAFYRGGRRGRPF